MPQYRFDVLVIGGGAAGSAAALAAAARGAHVAVVTKAELRESNTRYAQGGMAAVLGPEDTLASHVEDTLSVGCGLARRDVVEAVVSAGPEAIESLLEIGAVFDRDDAGELQLSREGGHSQRRIVHAGGDATGLEIQRVLASAVSEHPLITTYTKTFVLDVLRADDGRVIGTLAQTERNELACFFAGHVVLATGGAGQIYRETTNPVIATGDGVVIGMRAGAVARDLEFIQFHPTCLYIAGAARVLISEVVRGQGGVLRDKDGVRFMPDFHPDAELAPRDVVSRAVASRMDATMDTNVYLDVSNLDEDPHVLFPWISRICRQFGIDIARDPIPVRPGAHYWIGGLRTDLSGQTSVPGLLAVGECASTGLHGANRMGSNSLLEALVLGTRAGVSCVSDECTEITMPTGWGDPPPSEPDAVELSINITDLVYSLKSIMWRQMGVERTAAGMQDAIEKIRFWSRAVRGLAPSEPRTWELQNMLLLAELSTCSALRREESRGVHYRSDFDTSRDEFLCHTIVRPHPAAGAVTLASENLPTTVGTVR